MHFPDETDEQNVDCLALQRSGRDVAQEEQDALHAWIQRQCTNKTIFMGKSDLQSAFRILPIKPQQRRWLVMKAKNPMSGKFMFFVDKNLPFGASSSCSRFQLFSDSLKHIIEHQLNMPFTVTNYLDDYLFIADDQDTCNAMVSRFLLLCKNIGCPVSIKKTDWASSQMIFLGILIDGEKQVLCIPEDKKIKAMDLLNWAITHKKVTIKFIQRLTGVLNFLSKAIIPGRAYTREMYKKLCTTTTQGQPLKQYHHVTLGNNFIQDCYMWKPFLLNADKEGLCRPFTDINRFVTFKRLNFFSDSSANHKLGFGAIFGKRWIVGTWGKQFMSEEKPSIKFLELFSLVAGIFTWGHLPDMINTKVIIFCDNQSVRAMVNKQVSNCTHCLKLVRLLTLNNLQFNRRVMVKYVQLKSNILSDALSRLDFKTFWEHAPKNMNLQPDDLPASIWPIQKIWCDL